MRIGVLTSSRADYGIYLPLLKAIVNTSDMDLGVIAFGTHLSKTHGYTVDNIVQDGFSITTSIDTTPKGDSPADIAESYALTTQRFARYWSVEGSNFDFVFALGDRYEMSAAVAASIPFGIKIAHIHGGETTLGAIDNIYRHSISLASALHFVSTKPFEQRLQNILGDDGAYIYNVGSMSLENLEQMDLLDILAFKEKWDIDLEKPTILVTVHPETIAYKKNEEYCVEIIQALETLATTYQIVITMPNADTAGMIYRNGFTQFAKQTPSVHSIENLGTQSYFTCMKYAQLLIGNTSSGIIEAASFNKYVINLGDRPKGRLCGENVIHVPFGAQRIIDTAKILKDKSWDGSNIYYQTNPSIKILDVLRMHFEKL